jgi:hypothetical protein
MKKPSSKLTARDCDILKFIHRHRLGTDEILRHAFFPDCQENRPVRKVMRRLVERKFLREYSPAAGAFYYVLAPRGARALGEKPREPRPLTEQSLPGTLAVAAYCAVAKLNFFTAQKFAAKYPYFCKKGMKTSGYFVEETKHGLVVGFFITDRATKRRKMLSKIRRVIRVRYRIDDFAKLIQARRFVILILTGHEAKKQELERAIARRHRGPVQVRVEVVPELGTLLMRLQKDEAARRDHP